MLVLMRMHPIARGLAVLAAFAATAAAQPEFIFEKAPFPSCHASTIAELKNGDLLAAWFGGTAEGNPDVAIWGARRANGKWSEPFEMAREPEIPAFNPVLFHSKDNKLWLYFKFGPKPDNWTGARMWSADEGRTWSAREYLPAGLYGPIRARPLVMEDGTIVSGTSVESYGSWACWVERSTDSGKTFRRIGPITVPSNAVPGKRSYGIIQPSVVPMGGKKLRIFARATAQIGKICVADSSDAGLTWTAARPIDVPNPNSGLDAVALRDGRIVLVFNNTSRGRTPLNLAVSQDGERFTIFRDLETEPGEYSYPTMIQGRNGDLHITYTWKRSRIRYVRVAASDIPKAK
jgi:predicted neuraminidase